MKPTDIIPGHIYEAKRPQMTIGRGKYFVPGEKLVDDRLVLWINSTKTRVQWDGPKCRTQGGKPEVIDMDRFLKWAARDITAIMPEGRWREWQSPTPTICSKCLSVFDPKEKENHICFANT